MEQEMIIAVDFDGTLVEPAYPEIGEDLGAVPYLKACCDLGAKLILWTVRDGKELEWAAAWCKKQGLELWGINKNPNFRSESPKPHATIFIDDRGFGAPLISRDGETWFLNWEEVGPNIVGFVQEWRQKHLTIH